MTPKERAKYLILKFAFKGAQHEGEAKTFAIITVDEIIQELDKDSINYKISLDYWNDVIKELNKL